MNSYNCKDIYRYYAKMGGTLSYATFKTIIAENNKLNSALIINKGYEYEMPHKLFLIKVIRNKRKIKLTKNGTVNCAVNWGETKKLKARLLEEGKTLYECIKDEQGNIISDNGGEKYMVYFTDSHYYIIRGISSVFTHNCSKYIFEPTWTNERALAASITEDSVLIYKETKNGSSRRDFIEAINAKSRLNVRTEQQ